MEVGHLRIEKMINQYHDYYDGPSLPSLLRGLEKRPKGITILHYKVRVQLDRVGTSYSTPIRSNPRVTRPSSPPLSFSSIYLSTHFINSMCRLLDNQNKVASSLFDVPCRGDTHNRWFSKDRTFHG